VHGWVLVALTAALLVSALARRLHVSAPLVLVVAGLAVGLIPGVPETRLNPHFVLDVILPPLVWAAGSESSYLTLRRNARAISYLAVGLTLATTVAVGLVAYQTVPTLTLAAALTLGAIVAPTDAVSATAIGRRLGLPRRVMVLLGGESLLNDATALTVYKVALASAIGMATSAVHGLAVFVLAVVGGAAVGAVLGGIIVYIRSRLNDAVVESGIGLVAPFVVYTIAESVGGSGVLAVVVAALLLGHRSVRASYATRLQDRAVWNAVTLIFESLAFLLIGLQLPAVIRDLHGMALGTLASAAVAVFVVVLGVRFAWVYTFAYLPRALFASVRQRQDRPTPAGVFIVAWAGMRGVVSLAAAFGVPLTRLSGAPFPGRAQIEFLSFAVVIGTLLLQGLTLPWLIRRLGAAGSDPEQAMLAAVAAQDKAARAAAARLDALLAQQQTSDDVHRRAAEVLRHWNTRQLSSAREPLDHRSDESGESPASAFRRLRLDMLDVERSTFIAERDSGKIDDELLRELLIGLDLEEATLRRN
jgi:CPA1 family monovalent cation:H+ antiporter